jgi:hypothetical protein
LRWGTSLFAALAPSHYRLGEADGRTWLLPPSGPPVAWRYDPAALETITVGTDPFDDEVVTAVEAAAMRGRERTSLVGYTWTPSDWSPARVTKMRALAAESAGKQQYVGYLKERYAYSIERVNEIYGLESTSFSDLLIESFARLDTAKPAVAEDDRLFLADTAGRLAEAIASTLRKAHPGALLFSEPCAGLAARAFAPHVDVLLTRAYLSNTKPQVLLGVPPTPLPSNVVGQAIPPI